MTFNCPVEFDCETDTLCFDEKWLSCQRSDTDTATYRQAKAFCESEKIQWSQSLPLTTHVPKLISEVGITSATLENISERLHMSPRTLHRRLKESETSFQQIIDNMRKRKAEEALLDTNESILNVALTLGYSDVANFRRACHRWFGCSPQQHRQRVLAIK